MSTIGINPMPSSTHLQASKTGRKKIEQEVFIAKSGKNGTKGFHC